MTNPRDPLFDKAMALFRDYLQLRLKERIETIVKPDEWLSPGLMREIARDLAADIVSEGNGEDAFVEVIYDMLNAIITDLEARMQAGANPAPLPPNFKPYKHRRL